MFIVFFLSFFRKIKLPKTDGTFGLELLEDDYSNSLDMRPTTGHNTLQLSQPAIAGLSGVEKEQFLIGITIIVVFIFYLK